MSAVLKAREPSAKYLSALQPPLVQQFDLLATAPGGVARLRELILTLAVQGKLVPQDPSNAPATDLLRNIQAEKNRLIAIKSFKRERDEPEPTEDVLPFDLPASWTWTALGTVTDIVRGITFPASHKTKEAAPGRIACLRTSNVQQTIEWDDLLFVDRSFMGREDQLIQHHDIVMSMANSRELVGKVALIDHIPHAEATFGGFLGVLRPRMIDPRYAMAVLRTPYAREMLIDSSSQTTNIANVSLGKLRPLPFPLPPAAEQARIVARVEELMRLCDALEAKGQLEAVQHAQLVQTLLGALTASTSPEELADNWQRVATHFDLLLDRPEAIDALEQTILQLAMRGLLTKQLPSDGKAGTILLDPPALPEGTKRRRKILRRTRDTGIESDLPGVPLTWEWISIQDLYDLNVIVDYADGNHGSLYPRSDEFGPEGVTFVSAKDIAGGGIKWDTCSKLNEQRAAQLNKGWAKGGDVLLTHNATVGRVALVEGDAAPFLLGTSVTFYRTNACALDASYLFFAFMSPVWQNQLERVMEQTTRNQVSIQKQAELLVPLPPLAEQLRIVALVESSRRLCADLRRRLAARQNTQAHLAEALIDEVA